MLFRFSTLISTYILGVLFSLALALFLVLGGAHPAINFGTETVSENAFEQKQLGPWHTV